MSFLRTYFQRNKWRNWRDGIMNIKGRNNKEQKDAHIIRQHITRQTRDFFTTFNKTLSTMYAFFYSNTLKVTYIRVVYMYIYVIRRCHIPRNILTLLNLRLSLSRFFYFRKNEISLSLYTDNKRNDFRHQSATMNTV